MVKTCSVKGCKSQCYAGCNISFHSFPKNEEYRQKWQLLVPVNITKNSTVCSRHFTPKDFVIRNSRNMLVPDAIPSIFPVAKEKQNMDMVKIELVPPKVEDAGSSSPDGARSSIPDSACSSSPDGARSSSPDEHDSPVQPPIFICTVNQKSVAVQTIITSFSLQTSEELLKRKVKVLTQRLRRRDAKIESLEKHLKFLTQNQFQK